MQLSCQPGPLLAAAALGEAGDGWRRDRRPTMSRSSAPGARRPRTFGALAVLGVVVAFSLSSTLVKRAESPGVLVAFWRMTTVSIVWNAYLWSTGRDGSPCGTSGRRSSPACSSG